MEKLKILSLIFGMIFLINFVSSVNVPLWVFPEDNGGNPQYGYTANYNFSFSTQSDCSDSVFSYRENFQTGYNNGRFFVNITTPSSISLNPKYLCVYRNNGLWQTMALPNGYFDKVYADSFNATNNVSGDWFIGKVNYSDVQNVPTSSFDNASFNQSYANTLYAPNTTFGIQSLINSTGIYGQGNTTQEIRNAVNDTIRYNFISNRTLFVDSTAINSTQMSISNNIINLLESWFTSFLVQISGLNTTIDQRILIYNDTSINASRIVNANWIFSDNVLFSNETKLNTTINQQILIYNATSINYSRIVNAPDYVLAGSSNRITLDYLNITNPFNFTSATFNAYNSTWDNSWLNSINWTSIVFTNWNSTWDNRYLIVDLSGALSNNISSINNTKNIQNLYNSTTLIFTQMINTTLNIQNLYNATMRIFVDSINNTKNIQELLNSTGIYAQNETLMIQSVNTSQNIHELGFYNKTDLKSRGEGSIVYNRTIIGADTYMTSLP